MNQKRNTLSFLGLTICVIAIVSSVILFLITEGADAWKMKIAYIGFVLFMLHSCYRIWKFKNRNSKNKNGNEMQQKLRQVYSASDVLRAFFAPKGMHFRTSFSLFIILILGLFASSIWFWTFVILLIISKSMLLYSYFRYWKVFQLYVETEMNTDMDDDEYCKTNEETVRQFTKILKSLERDAIEIRFSHKEKASGVVGYSKYGGCPDVPEGFQWPKDADNRPLSLLLQINCSDLTSYDKKKVLPSTGHLYFFYELSDQDLREANDNVRVVYNDVPDSELHRQPYPEDLEEEFRLEEMPLAFSTRKSYPTFDDYVCISSNYDDMHALEEYDMALERLQPERENDVIGTMLGYADIIQNNIVENLNENILLLQLFSIESEDVDELMFGDCGNLYFYISRKDLSDKHFNRTVFDWQCC